MIDKKVEESACTAIKKLSWVLSAPQVAAMLKDVAALLKTYSAAALENWKPENLEQNSEGH